MHSLLELFQNVIGVRFFLRHSVFIQTFIVIYRSALDRLRVRINIILLLLKPNENKIIKH